jgi:D-alanyl-D-alanine carboxypeptidase/D-alanyl-D-alanine-endopeptidase (penicillin-binding protein 4)
VTTASVPSAPAGGTVTSAAPKTPPALAELKRALLRGLRAAGPDTGAVVYDLTAHRSLFNLRGATARPPASVEKLYTSVAVLSNLGPTATLQTSVLGNGHRSPGGVWHGDLYLRGGGDPTFGDGVFNQVWEGGYGATAEQLAAQLRRAGIRRVTGHVIGDASLFDARRGTPASGFAPDIPDLGGQLAALTYDHGATARHLSPGAFAARELVLTLRRSGIRARAARLTGITPPEARPLATVSSPPMSVLLRLTDVPSDDFFAEMLTKQLGVRFGGSGSTAAGAGVISEAVARLGLTPHIVDGSGLSRADRTSPLQVVDLLRELWPTPNGRLLRRDLAVVGVSGTVQHLAVHTPAHGRCQAKTGTLNYVTNLAGYCDSHGGHTLAFALFLDGPSNARSTQLLGRMVAAIARY